MPSPTNRGEEAVGPALRPQTHIAGYSRVNR